MAHLFTEAMPIYATSKRDYTRRTALWREPMEEENVGLGALYEVTCGSYKHITRTSHRRSSIARLRSKDGSLIASHTRGAVGRMKSERVSPLITKVMHENLPSDARLHRWAGNNSG